MMRWGFAAVYQPHFAYVKKIFVMTMLSRPMYYAAMLLDMSRGLSCRLLAPFRWRIHARDIARRCHAAYARASPFISKIFLNSLRHAKKQPVLVTLLFATR